ncbi:MAG: DNA-3-methyladenine glycosylase 2 family protein [Bacteroidetes bacterium]|nr:MAG: DNA-3-methyladenine glycosylase 2 family protein [Bacteroidota bacterium]
MKDILEVLAQADARLVQVFRNTEIAPLTLTDDVYGRLIRAIVFQQLSGKAATTIYHRFLALFDAQYPHPEAVLQMDLAALRQVGLSKQKAAYIQNAAGHFAEHHLLATDWNNWTDEAILKELTQIKGVGEWTVQMILIFTLGRPDVLPTADLAIQQCMQQLYGLEGRGKALARQMIVAAEPWRPHRSLVTRYLWRWRDTAL